MSDETSKKQPKPFLKKGTRQFLSNAQTRSLNQKPKIVDFTDQQQNTNTMNSVTFGRVMQEELKITVKKSTFKDPQIKVNVGNKTKENKPLNQEKMVKETMSGNKKKPAGLEDYLGSTSQNKNNRSRQSFSKEKSTSVTKTKPPVLTMAATLTRQEQIDDSDEEPFVEEKMPPKQNKFPGSTMKPLQPPPVAQNPMFQSGQVEEVHFNSDSDDEKLPKPNNILKPKVTAASFKKSTFNKNRWQEEEEEPVQQSQNHEAGSKIFQKFYQKEDPKRASNKIQTQKAEILTIDKIPKELREQIINQHILDKKCEIENKLLAVQQAQIKAKQEKQKFEQINKALIKQKQQHKREYESKMKEVEEKFKSQNERITREKRYLKGHQEGAKGDWKLKNQVEDLKGKLAKVEKEKKDMKVKLQGQIDRLQGKLQEINHQNETLKQSIKYIEKQKLQLKTKVNKPVALEKVQNTKPINNWEGAPTRSYIYKMTEPTFSLLDLDLSCFNFQNLEHYQYYLTKKDEKVALERENNDSEEKLVRLYKNGKEQIEYVNRLLKQKFPAPFNFTVVSFINGDSKFIYPEGIQIYYDQRGQITQFKLSSQKTIYNFHKLGQLELKYRHPQLGDVHQLRKNDILVRNSKRGEEKFKKMSNGTVQQIG